MGAKTLVSLEEYLRTSFDDYDREYVDGEIVERPLPDNNHSEMQGRLCRIFDVLGDTLPFHIRPELRTRVAATRVRIPDVAVFAGERPSERFPSKPPLVAIEILSLDDRPDKLLEKLEDYRKWGVPHIWVVDPEKRELSVYRDGTREKLDVYEIPEYNVKIPASEIFRRSRQEYNRVMGAKTLVSLEEYLRTSFDDYDREYVDGEIVERPLPDNDHSEMQGRLCLIIGELSKTLPFHGRPELRTRVAATRVRIPDLAVYAGQKPTERFPATPPLVAIEILSLDDQPDKLLEKLEDYRKWGVPHIWVVDPEKRELSVYRDGTRVNVDAYEIPEYNVKIPASEIFR